MTRMTRRKKGTEEEMGRIGKEGKKMGGEEKLLRLLWRREVVDVREKTGPKPGLSVDRLVTVAIGVADRDGLEALTIRKLAKELGLGAMSLYTYVADKSELLELMIDEAYLAMPELTAAETWRDGVRALAGSNLALYRRHPWLAETYSERPPLGPGVIGKYERELAVLDGLGLSDVELDAALSFVLNFVRAAARDELQAARIQALTQASNSDWWQAQEQVLSALLPAGKYPLAERVGSAAGEHNQGAYHAGYAYEFGLERVLDGLAKLIQGR